MELGAGMRNTDSKELQRDGRVDEHRAVEGSKETFHKFYI